MVRQNNLITFAKRAKKKSNLTIWNYISAGSEDENTVLYNRTAFSRWKLKPRVLTGSENIDTSVVLFGQRLSSPIILAPIGYQGLIHKEAELASVRGSNAANNLMTVSTMSNYALEELAIASKKSHWFQLYCMKDKELTLSFIKRAEKSGYGAIMVTVDTPRLGRRERNLVMRNKLTSQLFPGNFSREYIQKLGISSFGDLVEKLFDSRLDWSIISWLKNQTKLPLLLKGILTAEDAKEAVAHGIDGIVISNHGGRQLDGAIASIDALPEIIKVVKGRCKVLIDGGIRRGTDILKARALGADAVLIGRPILWGLISNGTEGVKDILTILKNELEHAMLLSGQSSWTNVKKSLVTLIDSPICSCCNSILKKTDIL